MTDQPKKKSRNKIYEEKQEAKGLKKVTVWCPDYAVDDFSFKVTK